MTILRISIVTLLSTLCFSQNPSQQNEITRRIDEYLKRATDSGLFSGTVAVAQDDNILFSRGYGMADLAFDVSNTPQTRFDIASVSKTFSAALVLWLQDRGSLRVDDPVCKYLDNCPDACRPVTIRHLLTHTSGILNYTELPDYFENALESFLPNAMKQIRGMRLQFPPGDRFAYSNTGYKLLHEIVQRASGEPYERLLRSKILDPLGMKNTGFLESANQLFALYLRGRSINSKLMPFNYWLQALLFYGVSAAGHLLLVIPRAGLSVVSDSAGEQWKVSDITGTCALVTIFTMGAFALVACVRLADENGQAKPL